nr:hypothetical protein [uncultured Pseudomonas sp.]
MTAQLETVFNYVSAQVKAPGVTNTIYAQSAHDAKVREQLTIERQELDKHKAFVELNFDSAEKHFKTVQLAGYAVFFAIWGFTRQWIPPTAEAFAALSMIVSAVVFVFWELGKASTLAAILRKHAHVSGQGLDHFLVTRSSKFASKNQAISFFSGARVWVWWLCVLPALCAVGIMVGSTVLHLLGLALA